MKELFETYAALKDLAPDAHYIRVNAELASNGALEALGPVLLFSTNVDLGPLVGGIQVTRQSLPEELLAQASKCLDTLRADAGVQKDLAAAVAAQPLAIPSAGDDVVRGADGTPLPPEEEA